MFWEDIAVKAGRNNVARVMPPIPDTGWKAPTYFPNLSGEEVLAIDVEAYDPEMVDNGPGWARGTSSICGASVGLSNGMKWYFPCGHTVEPQDNLPKEHVLAWLRDTLGNPKQIKVGANLIYDVGILRSEGVAVRGELVDVQFAEALLDERAEVNLETLAQKYLGVGKTSSLLYEWCSKYYGGKPNGLQRANIYRAPPRLVGPYAEGDVDLPIRIAREMYPLLREQGLLELFSMECRLIPLLIEMRLAGVTVDVEKAEVLRDQLIFRAQGYQAKLNNLVGFGVDVNAGQSIAKAFDKMGYPYKRTAPTKNAPKGNPSFTKEFLAECHNPVADCINEIRKVEKLRGTFIESYILESHKNGKIYCQFHPLRADDGGTRSGRFSSSDPNLQNIPIRDPELGPLLRGLFLPDSGHKQWRKYDYSQIEYRCLIHYAVGKGSDEARANFNAHPETDYHDWALDLIAPHTTWDISTKALRKEARRPVKNLNFGLIFGMGEAALAHDLGMALPNGKPSPAAKKLFAAYHNGVPFAKATIEYYSALVQEQGFIQTILGRRSRFDLWEPQRRDYNAPPPPPLPFEEAILIYGAIKRAYAFRGLNRELQGSAADILKAAMLKCWEDGVFDVTGVPRLTVHDELDFSDRGAQDEAFLEMKNIMETAVRLKIPIRADCDVGPDWGHVEAMQ